jgi:hypothetical protein
VQVDLEADDHNHIIDAEHTAYGRPVKQWTGTGLAVLWPSI